MYKTIQHQSLNNPGDPTISSPHRVTRVAVTIRICPVQAGRIASRARRRHRATLTGGLHRRDRSWLDLASRLARSWSSTLRLTLVLVVLAVPVAVIGVAIGVAGLLTLAGLGR